MSILKRPSRKAADGNNVQGRRNTVTVPCNLLANVIAIYYILLFFCFASFYFRKHRGLLICLYLLSWSHCLLCDHTFDFLDYSVQYIYSSISICYLFWLSIFHGRHNHCVSYRHDFTHKYSQNILVYLSQETLVYIYLLYFHVTLKIELQRLIFILADYLDLEYSLK